MEKKHYNISITVLCIIVAFLLSFDFYYFFIRRNVGPDFYLNKLIDKPSDNIIESGIYKDLRNEYQKLNNNYGGKSVIVFVGDSITKRFNTYEFFKNEMILNRGIFSDTTFGLINRLESNINNLQIDKLFIMIGYNDLRHRDNNQIVSNIEKIVRMAKAKTKYVQSILPVDSDRPKANKRIDAVNAKLKESSKTGNYVYIDISTEFKDNAGGIDPKLTRDGVHPNYFGYKLWFSIISDYL